jgi:4-amino-4-deoxy-L-arabinose transferase-like glycosyltransferase
MSLAARELPMLDAPPVATGGRVYGKTILALALVLRLGVVSMVLFRYPRNWLFSKAPDLVFVAHSLSSGRGLSSPFGGSTGPTAFLAPGYPAIIGLVFRLFGSYSFTSAVVIMGLQTLFAVLTVAVIMHIARRIFGATTANLAGVFWAVSPPLIWLPAVLWETSLSTLLLTGMVALAIRAVNNPGKGLWVVMGAYCALAMLVNPSLMLALFAILGWTIYQTRPVGRYESRYELWMCSLALLAVFAPWPLRNVRVFHAFIPLRSNFGYELWQGNHPGATGVFDATIEPLQNKQEYADYAAKGEVVYMGEKSTLAKAYIRAQPGRFIRLSAERVARFWTGAGSAANSGVIELHAVATSLLGVLGLAALCKERCVKDRARAMLFLLPILVFPLPYYITHPDFRFRLLLDPLLTILGAYALTRLGSYWKIKRGA